MEKKERDRKREGGKRRERVRERSVLASMSDLSGSVRREREGEREWGKIWLVTPMPS